MWLTALEIAELEVLPEEASLRIARSDSGTRGGPVRIRHQIFHRLVSNVRIEAVDLPLDPEVVGVMMEAGVLVEAQGEVHARDSFDVSDRVADTVDIDEISVQFRLDTGQRLLEALVVVLHVHV